MPVPQKPQATASKSAYSECWDYLLRLSVCGARRELLQFGAEQARLIQPDVDRRVRYLADFYIVVGARGLPAVIEQLLEIRRVTEDPCIEAGLQYQYGDTNAVEPRRELRRVEICQVANHDPQRNGCLFPPQARRARRVHRERVRQIVVRAPR